MCVVQMYGKAYSRQTVLVAHCQPQNVEWRRKLTHSMYPHLVHIYRKSIVLIRMESSGRLLMDLQLSVRAEPAVPNTIIRASQQYRKAAEADRVHW
jgi:hypothetical protein